MRNIHRHILHAIAAAVAVVLLSGCGEYQKLLKSKDLLGLTGYVHGGCSPIGMKKPFPTVVDETAQMHERILFSAGRRGEMVELSPDDLLKIVPYAFADVIRL